MRYRKYRKKPVVIAAAQWDGTVAGASDIIAWVLLQGGTARYDDYTPGGYDDHSIQIDTLEGTMRANPGWWIIRGVAGEFYSCDPDIFAKTYDQVVGDDES